MEGIEILNKTPIMKSSDIVVRVVQISFLLVLIGLILFLIFSILRFETLSMICILIAALGFFSSLIFVSIKDEESGQYRYECIVSDNVKLTEFYEKYDVIEINGKIWTIEDK